MRGERGVLNTSLGPLKTRHLFQVYFRDVDLNCLFLETRIELVRDGAELRPELGEAAAVAKHDGEEFARVPVARDIAFGLGEGAKEPAEVELVGPDGNVDLVAAEEGDGGADAVNGGAVVEFAFEVEAEALLRTAAYGDDDVLRTQAIEMFEQRRVVDGRVAVHRSHVDVVFGDDDSLPCEPGQIALCADRAGHDPEGVAGFTDVRFEEQFAEVLETGETLDWNRAADDSR